MSNIVNDASFLDVLLALKQNIMKDLSVAEIMIVTETNAKTIKCKSLTNSNMLIECIALQNVSANVNDVVLVVFTNTDFRSTLSKLRDGRATQNIVESVYHSKNYGVIIGIIDKKEN